MCVIEKSPIIETRRLTLRAPQTDDASRIAALCGDFAIAKMTTRMPWPYSQSDADGFVARCQVQDRREDSTFVIDLEDEGVVGVLGFFTPPDGHLEIGYWVGRPYWGRGLATRGRPGRPGLGQGGLAQEAGRRRPLRRQPGLGPGAGQGRLPLHGRRRAQAVDGAAAKPVPTRMMVWLA